MGYQHACNAGQLYNSGFASANETRSIVLRAPGEFSFNNYGVFGSSPILLTVTVIEPRVCPDDMVSPVLLFVVVVVV